VTAVTTADLDAQSDLEFIEDDHEYLWGVSRDGYRERLPSVTEMISDFGLGPDYSSVPTPILKAAGVRGRAFHLAVQYGLEDDLDLETVAPSIRDSVIKAIDLLHEARVQPIIMERPIASATLRYGGTSDLFCQIHRVPRYAVIDYKTGETRGVDIQLSFYSSLIRELLLQNTGKVLRPEDVDLYSLTTNLRGGVWLNKIDRVPDLTLMALTITWRLIDGRKDV